MMGDRTLVMVKGPSRLGVNFRFTMDRLRFLASSYTLSPSLNGVKECRVWVAMTCHASLWEAEASSQSSREGL